MLSSFQLVQERAWLPATEATGSYTIPHTYAIIIPDSATHGTHYVVIHTYYVILFPGNMHYDELTSPHVIHSAQSVTVFMASTLTLHIRVELQGIYMRLLISWESIRETSAYSNCMKLILPLMERTGLYSNRCNSPHMFIVGVMHCKDGVRCEANKLCGMMIISSSTQRLLLYIVFLCMYSDDFNVQYSNCYCLIKHLPSIQVILGIVHSISEYRSPLFVLICHVSLQTTGVG